MVQVPNIKDKLKNKLNFIQILAKTRYNLKLKQSFR